jgi:hypothetical protein
MTDYIEKRYEQQLPIYGYTVHVVVSTNINKSRIKRDKVIGRGWEEDYTTRALHSGISDKPVSYIFMPANARVGEIVHESVHACQRIVEWIGATYRDPELIAYLIGYVTEGVYQFVGHFNKIYKKELDKLEREV